MASLDASLNSLDSTSLRRLFELAVWDANYCASTFQTILATQPMGLAYAIYNRPGFAATLPTGATLPTLTADELTQIDTGQLPQELVSPFGDLKTALGLVSRP